LTKLQLANSFLYSITCSFICGAQMLLTGLPHVWKIRKPGIVRELKFVRKRGSRGKLWCAENGTSWTCWFAHC